MIRHLLIYAVWLAAVAGVFAAMFAPGIGLIHAGPPAAVGLLLLGGALVRQHGIASR